MDVSQVRLAPDKVGNVYLSYFHWESNYGYPDGSAIAKYDSMGNELWQKDFTSKIRIKDIVADSFGAFYITGDFRDIIYIDSVTLISAGNNDAFLAKFNSSGNLQWIKKSGGLYNDCGVALCLDTKENIYLTGEYSDSAFFYGNWISDNISNMTVSKFDSSGNLIFFKSSNTDDSLQGSGSDKGERIKLDNCGNIIVLGSFNDAQYICKLDTAGQMKWLKAATWSPEKFNDFVVGDDNSIFATGGGSWTNGRWTITKRLDTLGNSLWNQGCGLHCGYYGDGILNGVANDFANIIVYGNGSCCGLLLVKYAFDGSLVYMDTIHATDYIGGKSIVRDSNGKYIISGFIRGAIKLGSDSIYSSTGKIFIAKFSDAIDTVTTPLILSQTHSNILCNGQCTGSAILNAIGGTPPYIYSGPNSGLCAGTYIFTVTDSNGHNATTTVTITQPNAIAVSVLAANTSTYINSITDLLTGIPSGGTFSGIGVSGTNFDPSLAGVGTWPVTYTYSDTTGCADTATINITVNLSTGFITNEVESGMFEVYPNPSYGIFTVNLKHTKAETKICVYDALGKCVLDKVSMKTNEENIDLTGQPKGVYSLEIESNGVIEMKKIVLQ